MKKISFSMLMALVFMLSSFSVEDTTSNGISGGIIVAIFCLLLLLESSLEKFFRKSNKKIKTDKIYKKFRKLAKYLPGLGDNQIEILNIYSGKANGFVKIFNPYKVSEFERELIDVETFSAECLLLDEADIIYLYITRDGDMIDIVLGHKTENADCIFSFEPEKEIKEDGAEVLIHATS